MPQKVLGLVGALWALGAPVSWACAPASFEGGLRAPSESFVPTGSSFMVQTLISISRKSLFRLARISRKGAKASIVFESID